MLKTKLHTESLYPMLYHIRMIYFIYCRNMNVFPSYILSDDEEHGFVTGTCVTTRINPLLSCSGGRQGHLRLCPCRQYRKGQVALPIEL